MTTIEFQLAKLAGGSLWRDPRDPPGGRPRLTVDELRAAFSIADLDPEEFDAMMTKYVQDRTSEERLVERVKRYSIEVFFDRYPDYPITANRNQGIAESAVLWFANPELGRKRGEGGAAIHVGVSAPTWRRYYRDHWKATTAWLFGFESTARPKVWRALA